MMTGYQNLVFVPAIACHEGMYQKQIDYLSTKFSCASYGLPPLRSLRDIALSILAKAPPRFVAVGASLGGYICFELVKLAPERITGLCLIGSSPEPDSPELAARRIKLNRFAAEGHFHDMWRRTIHRFVSPTRLEDRKFINSIVDHIMETSPQAFIAHNEAAATRPGYHEVLKDITCRTLLIAGRDDILTPLSVQQEMAAQLSDVKLDIFEETGHLPTFEEPLRTAQAIEQWMDEVELRKAA